jgi:hypothetical protein
MYRQQVRKVLSEVKILKYGENRLFPSEVKGMKVG